MEILFPATDDSIEKVNAFVEEELEKADCAANARIKVMIALEELFVNVAHYAYDGEKGDVSVSIDFEGNDMVLALKDKGKPFNPLEKPDPNVEASLEERGIGGLGIYMVKKTMDDFKYDYKDGENVVTIRHAIK